MSQSTFFVGIFSFILLWTIGAEGKNYLSFPKGFKVGVAGSAYQVEGAWNVSDKGLSVWDWWTHGNNNDKIPDGANGDIACDTFHKYKEDIEITKDAGFNHYRLSLSWTRILPTGFDDYVSEDGIQYYKDVLDELKAKGIEPFVTIYHWDHPEFLERKGGWMNEMMVEYFADYATVVFRELGSRVKFWTTINEPQVLCTNAYGKGALAPGLKLPKRGPYMCGHNMLKAHARAYRIYDKVFRKHQNGIIGTTLPCFNFFPVHENDTESSHTAFQFDCGWIAHPIFSKEGDYPKIMRERIDRNSKLEGLTHSRLPVFTPYWVQYIKGTFDYFGLNHYTSRMTESQQPINREELWEHDSGVIVSVNKTWPVAASSWLYVIPEGINGILRKIKSEYNNPPVYILENGYSSSSNDSLVDLPRIDYLYSHMKQVLLATNRDGCNVKAYTIWSLLDNFEWSNAYTKHFGIVRVNFNDPERGRTPRLSFSWLKNVMRRRELVTLNTAMPPIH